MEIDKKNRVTLVLFAVLVIIHVTLLSRTPTLAREIHSKPLWSFFNPRYWKQIILNVMLFVPLGFFLACLFSRSKRMIIQSIALSFVVSLLVECAQYYTSRGTADIDDLLTNCIGALGGILVWKTFKEKNKFRISVFLFCSYLLCCIAVSFFSFEISCCSEGNRSVSV